MKTYEIRVQRLNETPDAPKLESPETAVRYWQSVITQMPWYIVTHQATASGAVACNV